MIRVGIIGLSRREGTFAEVGLRSWEEAGCGAVERVLATAPSLYFLHRALVIRSARREAERILRDWCDAPDVPSRCHLILTVGGTGYTKKDVMPEAAAALIRRAAPGIAQTLRRVASEAGFLEDAVSRGVAGQRGPILLINLPGNAKGMANQECLTLTTRALLPVLPDILAGIQEGYSK